MINSGHIYACITSFDLFRRPLAGLITLRSRCQISVNWTEMFHNDTISPVIARYVPLWLHLKQRSSFCLILKNWLWIGYVRLWTPKSGRLHNTGSNGPEWPHLVNGDHLWSRIWSMNDLVHIEAEVMNLGLRYQVMAGMALLSQIEQIWPKVVYNGPIYVLEARYDKFWPY